MFCTLQPVIPCQHPTREEVSKYSGSDRMSTQVWCGFSELVNMSAVQWGGRQMAGEPRSCSSVSAHVEGCREQREVFVNTFWPCILLLSTRIYDSLHLYRIIVDKWFKPNSETLDKHKLASDTQGASLLSKNIYMCTCEHEQKASHNTFWGSWVHMQLQEKVTYSRRTYDTPRVRSLHKNTINRSPADFLCHRGWRSIIHYRHLSL